ncbi:MAG: DUF2207 family protein [Coriobacteriales bacterium]|jgi:uncharacterized membrane protein
MQVVHASRTPERTRTIAFVVFALAFVCALLAFLPQPAWAKSHSCTKDVIEATVNTDGSLHVVDSRTYSFEGSYTLTAAVLSPPNNGTYKVNGVSVIDSSGNKTALKKVKFQRAWRQKGGPASERYAIDTAQSTVYAFSDTTDDEKTFVFDYVYTNTINRYNDCSVLYWKFVGRDWDVDTNDVSMTVTLPVAQGESMQLGNNVLAYGHGNLDGNVSGNDSDGTVTFTVPKVESGSYAEARIAFPRSWTPDVASTMTHDIDELSTVKSEEEQWQQQANRQRIISMLLLVIPLLISVVMIVVAVLLYRRYGKEHKPQFTDKYWRDVPEKGLNPLVVARLMRWNKQDDNDLVPGLMNLSTNGYLSIDRAQDEEEGKRKKRRKKKQRFVLKRTDKPLDGLDAVDAKTCAFIFDTIDRSKSGSITIEQIEDYAEDNPQDFSDQMSAWQQTLDDAVYAQDFFEAKGERYKRIFKIVASTVLVIGFAASFNFFNFAPILGLLPGIIVMYVMARFMPRRSERAVEIFARAEALERWLKDFTHLEEAIPTDAKVWGELLVYAYIFGIADQVSKQLNAVNPDIWEDPYFAPCSFWYYDPYASAPFAAAAGASDFFGEAFSNTMQSVHEALAPVTSGDFSGGFSGGGGGGGFSGGGGGGFGGGGGGFSR